MNEYKFQYSYTTSDDLSNNTRSNQPRRNDDHIYDEINYPAWKGDNKKTIT